MDSPLGGVLRSRAAGVVLSMTEKQFRDWLESYGRAWEGCDPDAAAALFSDAAEYYETPFGAPCLGREGIREYWLGATGSQRDISFTHQILSLASNMGIARWAAEYTRVASGRRVCLNGIFVLIFDEDGSCSTLREWWHRSESSD